MAQINIAEAKARLSELIDRALTGEVVVVARDNKPLVRIVPYDAVEGRPRRPGSARGKITLSKDFDQPIPDFDDYR